MFYRVGDVFVDENNVLCLVVLDKREVLFKDKDSLVRFTAYRVKLSGFLEAFDVNLDELNKIVEEKRLTRAPQESDLLQHQINSLLEDGLIGIGASFEMKDGSIYEVVDAVNIFFRDGFFKSGELKKGYIVKKINDGIESKFALAEEVLAYELAFNLLQNEDVSLDFEGKNV